MENERSHFQADLEEFFCVTSKWLICIRSQQIARADIVFSKCIDCFEKLLPYTEIVSFLPLLLENFKCLLTAYEDRDYILCADYMEKGIISLIKQRMADWMPGWAALFRNGDYQLEYTESVAITVAKKRQGSWLYLHSNCNPWEEAFLWAEAQIKTGIETYHVAGLGLGYHALLLAENPLFHVVVYEEDKVIVEMYEKSIANTMWRKKENIDIVYDSDYQEFYNISRNLNEEKEKICLYYPSIQTIKDRGLNRKMKGLFLQVDNVKYWGNNFAINFAYNSTHIREGMKELEQKLAGKKVYLIAGGPSLDKNIAILKERSTESIVMTVGTSFRKCLLENIQPDYVIVTDPKPYVHKQIEGMENSNIPLIILSTTFAHVARDYKGKKYILYQKGFEQAEQYAKEMSCPMVETGGSVTTTALDLCIQCGVEKVVFLGLDLAFTDGKTHHDVAAGDKIGEGAMQVLDIYGNLVNTAENLNQYRLWIENRIAKARKTGCRITFIDATEGGARIQGTEVRRLCDEIKEESANE